LLSLFALLERQLWWFAGVRSTSVVVFSRPMKVPHSGRGPTESSIVCVVQHFLSNSGSLTHYCHMATTIKVPDRFKSSFVIFDIRALWQNYKWPD